MSDSDIHQADAAPSDRSSYTCPGELYSIPRSIHLARLAAYYSKCRECEHRFDAGHLFTRNGEQQHETLNDSDHTTLVLDESVRGVYLNELDRNRALLWGEALAAWLWERHPMVARRKILDPAQIIVEPDEQLTKRSRGPTVAVGFDERTSSPDIVRGAVLGLRRMGCPVIDLGQTGLPTLAFNVHSQAAAAGLFVTGAGCNTSHTGFEFVDQGGLPFLQEGLAQLVESVKVGVARQTRQIGDHQPHHGQADYESSLESHYHAIRPLRVVCGSASRLLSRTLDRLFAKLPCTLTHVSLPTRLRNLFDGRDVDLQRVATSVVDGRNHLGLIIDEDGRRFAFVTDRGRLVSPRDVARLLIEVILRENPTAAFVVATCWLNDTNQWLNGREAQAIDGGETIHRQVRTLIEREAVLSLSADGRVWFNQPHPSCDALLVLAKILQALSFSDNPFSEVIARINAISNDTGGMENTRVVK